MRSQLQTLPLLPGWLLISLLLLLSGMLSLIYPPLMWAMLALGGIGALALALGSPWLCCQLMMLGLFTGTLTALPVGFTLKAPQFFALLGLGALLLESLRRRRLPDFPWHWAWPFSLFLLCILPSFLTIDRTALSLGQAESSLRLLMNYGLLQLFTLFLLLMADSLDKIVRLLKLAWLSCLAAVLFGFAQQAGFYLGVYDPYAYVGSHGSIIDFYGPFLRLAPGTFANEFGEILQSVGILLSGWLLIKRQPQERPEQRDRGRWLWIGMLLLVLIALVLNFTRASWLVFAFGGFLLLVAAGLRPGALLGTAVLGTLALGLLLYLSQILLAASVLLSIGQRFGELGQVQSHSAGQRLLTWQSAWQAFSESPWIGQGWGLFTQTHNVPLQLLAETGLIGCIGFYALMLWCLGVMYAGWRKATDKRHKALLLSFMLAFGGCLGFDLTNHGIYHFVLWFCIGMGLALARLSLYPPPADERFPLAGPAQRAKMTTE